MPRATYYVQECPTCGRRLQVRVVYLGRTVACQHCGSEFVAQDPSAGAPIPADSGVGLLQRAEELLAMMDSKGCAAPSATFSPAATSWQPLPR